MITPAYVRMMADYNRWQNRNLYGTADQLTDQQRKEQRGAFFGSIHGTLNHLVWGDQTWMSRFAGTPRPKAPSIPESPAMYETWDELKRERAAFDEVIIAWAEKLDPAWLEGVGTVGVTSGASVPEVLVSEVLDWLAERGYPDVETVTAAEERLATWRRAVARPTGAPAGPLLRGIRERLADDLDSDLLDSLTTVEPMSRVPELAEQILAGQTRGRIVIDVSR